MRVQTPRPLLLLAACLALGGTTGARPVAGQSLEADSLDDGPHVYLQDSRALAFYHCNGDFVRSEWFSTKGTVSLTGFCGDTTSTYVLEGRAPRVERDAFDDVSRIFAVSDIHGEYDALVDLLKNAGIVGDDLSWAFGEGHMVIAGDIFDRGDQVTECLWLIHRLEREARAAGGRVHYLLGNHEMMVMQGDLRYVHDGYLSGVVAHSGVKYPDLFGPAMELGRWLRTRHMAVRVNGIVFVHGGMGPEVVRRKLSLKDINEGARAAIDLRSYDLMFNDMPGFLLDTEGPLWYRGYHRASASYPQATDQDIDAILKHFDASAVVVGHTDVGEIQALYGGKVYGIDMSLERVGWFQGLLWEGGAFYRVDGDGSRYPLASGM